MSQEPESAPSSDGMSGEGKSTLAAMCGGFGGWTRWNEEAHTETDIRECTDQHCMNVEVNCGFQGLDPGSLLSQSASVSDDLRAAWRAKLKGEGKPVSETRSLRDIVFGPVS
jgi:ABC-type glutathione transport system ATPase component